MSVLPKLNRLRETQKRAQPTGCPLSHRCPRKLRSSYGVSQLIFKLREISSHENQYIYTMRKSHDQWLCTQSQISKRSMRKMWDVRAWWLCMVCDKHCAIQSFSFIQYVILSYGKGFSSFAFLPMCVQVVSAPTPFSATTPYSAPTLYTAAHIVLCTDFMGAVVFVGEHCNPIFFYSIHLFILL